MLIVDDQLPFRLMARTVVSRTAGFTVFGELDDGDGLTAAINGDVPDLVLAASAFTGWSGCENGAPKTAITASPTNCITVPPASRMAVFIAARCSLSWRARAPGGVASAMLV